VALPEEISHALSELRGAGGVSPQSKRLLAALAKACAALTSGARCAWRCSRHLPPWSFAPSRCSNDNAAVLKKKEEKEKERNVLHCCIVVSLLQCNRRTARLRIAARLAFHCSDVTEGLKQRLRSQNERTDTDARFTSATLWMAWFLIFSAYSAFFSALLYA
jgi:hypothetical protein